MRIRGFLHKGLKRLYLDDSSKGLPQDAVDKIRKMLAFIQDMESAVPSGFDGKRDSGCEL